MWRRILIGSLATASTAVFAASTVVGLKASMLFQSTGEYRNPHAWEVEHLVNGTPPVLGLTVAGCLLAVLRPRNALGWLFLACGLLLSCVELLGEVIRLRAAMTTDVESPANLFLLSRLHLVALSSAPTVVLVLYPDGRLPARWWRWPVGVVITSIVVSTAPTFLLLAGDAGRMLMIVPAAVIIVIAVLVRGRQAVYPQGPQLAWIVGCGLLAFACRHLVVADGYSSAFGGGGYSNIGPILLWALTDPMLIIPIGVAAFVLRGRSMKARVVLHRGLAYAALAVVLCSVYLSVAAPVTGLPLRDQLLPAVLTAAVIVGLVRARGWLQRAAARLVYGARRNPLQALAELSDSVAENNHLDLVPAAVATVAAAVGADGAVLVTPDGKVLARVGQEPDRYLALSLRFGGAEIGELRVADPPGGGIYSEVEVRLLTALATQLAVVVSAAELTESLEAERNRVVTATRDERDRLRRDLHDGLGPSLAGMSLGLQALAGQVGDPDTPAGVLVQRLRSGTDIAVRDIRRIIDGLRPTVLDTANLAQAVERHASSLGPALPVDVTATSLPGLAPDIEAAAYRIITEALTNTARHAHARHAHVTITADEALHIAVSDDGRGIPANTVVTGVGLSSMRRRAETLGGDLAIDSTDGGTTITATLPLSPSRCR